VAKPCVLTACGFLRILAWSSANVGVVVQEEGFDTGMGTSLFLPSGVCVVACSFQPSSVTHIACVLKC
jgi:hypothetical protein